MKTLEERLAERFGSLDEAKKNIDQMYDLLVHNPNPDLNEDDNKFMLFAIYDIRVALG